MHKYLKFTIVVVLVGALGCGKGDGSTSGSSEASSAKPPTAIDDEDLEKKAVLDERNGRGSRTEKTAKAQPASDPGRIKTLKEKVKRRFWDEEPDGACTGKGLPAYRWSYEGGTFTEDREVAEADGCKALFPESSSNTTFCCPRKGNAF